VQGVTVGVAVGACGCLWLCRVENFLRTGGYTGEGGEKCSSRGSYSMPSPPKKYSRDGYSPSEKRERNSHKTAKIKKKLPNGY
jgi:hypothetical protein